ncbi:MAG: DUF58 domain-containing protein [Candidatus Dormibacteria bacterium]
MAISGKLTTRAHTQADRIRDRVSVPALQRSLVHLRRWIGLTRSGYIALVGAVMLWLVARIVAGDAMYVAAYGAAGFVVVGVFLAPRRLGLTADRTGLFPRAQEGDRLDVAIKLTAKRSVSTFILEERLPEALGTSARVPVTRLKANQVVDHKYTLRCQRRGVYEVGPLVAVAADPLGLSRRERVIAQPFELLVHPRVEIVSDRPLTRQFEDPPIRPPVSKPWPSGLEFYGMREYAPGDDLRRIVWRATARTGKVMVREAEQGITDRITLIVDTDRGSHSREAGGSESFEAAARVAASLGVRHLRDGYEVRVETNGGPLVRPMRGAGSQLILLDGLARMTMHRDPLSGALMRLISNPRRDAHNVLITPHLSLAQAAQLRLLLNTGVSVLVVALLWDEEHADTLTTAASLGCQVAGVHPGQDLTSALYAQTGGGTR